MPWEEGNTYWTRRLKSGADKKYKTASSFLKACIEYIEWIETNPLMEHKTSCYEGIWSDHKIPKMRPMTISGCCVFIGISQKTWANYRERDDFLQVITKVEDIFRTQKFEGAAAGFLNSNIIARDLGLKDKSESETKLSLADELKKVLLDDVGSYTDSETESD